MTGEDAAMQIERKVGHAPKVVSAGQMAVSLGETCVGCEGCRGLCREFLEMLTLPEAIVRKS